MMSSSTLSIPGAERFWFGDYDRAPDGSIVFAGERTRKTVKLPLLLLRSRPMVRPNGSCAQFPIIHAGSRLHPTVQSGHLDSKWFTTTLMHRGSTPTLVC